MRRAAPALLLAFFALYVWTLPPSLAAYRDTGEFALSAFSLGISHPPSYPVYILLGRAAELLPLGNRAYALALLSSLSGAACLAVLFASAAPLFGAWPALCAALLLGLNVTFWVVCGVQEMYSLTLLFAAVLLALALSLRRRFGVRVWAVLWLSYGLFLGNRTDLVLWFPGLLVLAWPYELSTGERRDPAALRRLLLQAAGFGLLGLTVYLYLPLRSLRGPWLDWNHPATLYNLVGSLTRRGYGGTLDLLSKSYAMGSMFLPNLRVYGAHLWLDFGLLGLLLAAIGLRSGWRSDRRRFWAWALLYGASGPLFLFMANMPPNPHAMAIVEPHYLLSDLVLALWAAEGAAALLGFVGAETAKAACGVGLAAALAVQVFVMGHFRLADRRWDLVAHDSTANLLRSVPPGGVLVAKKDVQLFGLWYAQRVEGRRPDLRIVAQGLSHSPWYRASWRREGSPLSLGPLKAAEDWTSFAALNGPRVFASMDADVPPGVPFGAPRGLAVPISTGTAPSEAPWDFLVRRGDYRYEHRPDFFTSDLVNDHAVARQRLGSRYLDLGDDAAARRNLLAGWSMKQVFPEAGMFLGYLRLRSGDLRGARATYELTDELNERMLAFTREFHSLPEVTRSIAVSTAENRLNLGVVYEKLGDAGAAERLYLRALEADPGAAKAHYNLAVLYWNRDWRRVIAELETALRIDPNYEEAAKYLAMARTKAG